MLRRWQRYQDWLYEGLEFYLDVSRMRFDSTTLATLPKFEQAFQDGGSGGIANPDENHGWSYWLRIDLAPTPELKRDIVRTLIELCKSPCQCPPSTKHPHLHWRGHHWHWWGFLPSVLSSLRSSRSKFPPLAIHFKPYRSSWYCQHPDSTETPARWCWLSPNLGGHLNHSNLAWLRSNRLLVKIWTFLSMRLLIPA